MPRIFEYRSLEHMTETPVAEEHAANCRNCGRASVVSTDDADWLCPYCDHYQNTTACPTCGQPVAIDALPEGLRPPVHDPVAEEQA
jgi:hypothetical protein